MSSSRPSSRSVISHSPSSSHRALTPSALSEIYHYRLLWDVSSPVNKIGVEEKALVDTGSKNSFISLNLARRAGLEVRPLLTSVEFTPISGCRFKPIGFVNNAVIQSPDLGIVISEPRIYVLEQHNIHLILGFYLIQEFQITKKIIDAVENGIQPNRCSKVALDTRFVAAIIDGRSKATREAELVAQKRREKQQQPVWVQLNPATTIPSSSRGTTIDPVFEERALSLTSLSTTEVAERARTKSSPSK